MALVFADRVKETTVSTGTGTINLLGAVTNFQTFVAGIETANTCHYFIIDPTNDAWEAGIGTVTDGSPDTLSRDSVIDSSNSGALVNFGSGTKTVFNGPNSGFFAGGGGSSGFPKRYVEGLVCQFASTTTVDVGVGSCRDALNANDIDLTAARTADVTTGHGGGDGLAQDDGLDEKGLDDLSSGPITCSQTTTTITASGDITSHLGVRAGTGTITTVGTAGSAGTLLMSQIAIGDLIGNSSNGWSRVASVESDALFTLAVAIPGGDITTAAFSIMENASIQPNDTAKDLIDSIDSAGTAIVVATSVSHGGGSPLTIGVELDDQWLAIWVVDTLAGGAPKLLLSTQRTTPYTESGGTTKWANYRRIGWVRNNASGDFFDFYQMEDGRNREIRFEVANNSEGMRILASGSATSWTPVDASPIVPPTSTIGIFSLFMISPTALETAFFRRRNTGVAALTRNVLVSANDAGDIDTSQVRAFLDGAQFLDYVITGDNSIFIDVTGYVDRL